MPPTTQTYPLMQALSSIIKAMDDELEALREAAEKATQHREVISHQLNYYFTALSCPRIQCISSEPMLQIIDCNKLRMRDAISIADRELNTKPHSPQNKKRNYYNQHKGELKGSTVTPFCYYNFEIPNSSYIIGSRCNTMVRQREVAAYIKKRKLENSLQVVKYTEEYINSYNKWRHDDELSKLQRHQSINSKGEIKVDIYGRKKERSKSKTNKLITKMCAPIQQRTIIGACVDFESNATLVSDPFEYEKDYNK
jgi:hypothetical protein